MNEIPEVVEVSDATDIPIHLLTQRADNGSHTNSPTAIATAGGRNEVAASNDGAKVQFTIACSHCATDGYG
jgi:hypothetical protein